MTDADGPRHDAGREALVTFRVLRCALVAAALVLAVSLIYEAVASGEILGSISASFYSPVRSIFVGGLMAVGVCLIAIQAKTVWEDTFLNLAGLFAFAVALIPIRPDRCRLTLPGGPQTLDPGQPLPDWLRTLLTDVASGTCRIPAASGTDPLPGWVVAGIENNVFSVMVVGALALGALWLLRRTRAPQPGTERAFRAAAWSLAVYLVVLVAAVVLYATFDGINPRAHYVAAFAMFGMFGAVVFINGWRRSNVPPGFRRQYRTIGVLMILVAPLGLLTSVYWLEAAEIALFAWFWMAQTVQIWDPDTAAAQAVLPATA